MMEGMNTKTLVVLAGLLALILVCLITAYVTLPPKETTEAPQTAQNPLPEGDSVVSEDEEYYRISATSPQKTALQGSANATAVASMDSFIAATITDFKANSGLMTLTAEDIEMQGLGGERKYALDISYDAYASASTLSYVFVIYEDTMGAHPNAYYRTFTFSKSTGEELLISDLFTSSVYLAALSEGSRVQITETLGPDAVVSEYLESGTTPDAPNFQHFYLNENELVIIFPPYSVGPWAIGTQEARFPRSDFELLKPEYR